MPMLGTEGVPRLLEVVGGKPHATGVHHHEDPKPQRSTRRKNASGLATPDSSSRESHSATEIGEGANRELGLNDEHMELEQSGRNGKGDVKESPIDLEDLNRDPESSEDEDAKEESLKAGEEHHAPQASAGAQVDGMGSDGGNASGSKKRRSRDEDQADWSSDNQDEIFASSQPKKPRTSQRKPNIHVHQRQRKCGYGLQKSQKASQDREREAEARQSSAQGFKSARNVKLPTNPPKQQAVFRKPNLPPEGSPGPPQPDAEGYLAPSDSDPLSPVPSSPESVEIVSLDLPESRPYEPKARCEICEKDVDLSLKEEFEISFAKTAHMSFRWQVRFCDYHNRHDAGQLWRERKYPDIDWGGLEARMRKHHAHLIAVVSGARSSVYRDRHSENVKARDKSRAAQVERTEKKPPSVGYYGPRGGVLMSSHIANHLSDTIRSYSTHDRLLTASGAQGGVSGWIQSVLVPELAEQLVKEDMGLASEEDASELIRQSADLGNLLNLEGGAGMGRASDRGLRRDG